MLQYQAAWKVKKKSEIMDFVEECIKGGISKTSGYIEIETEYVNSYEYLGGKHGLD